MIRPATLRRTLAALLALLPAVASPPPVLPQASPPELLHYQGRLLTAAGEPVTGVIDMEFLFYDAVSGGAPLLTYSRDAAAGQTGVTVRNGLYSLLLGETPAGALTPTASTSSLSELFRENASVFLETRVKGAGGYETLSPRTRLGSAGHALHAASLAPGAPGQLLATDGTPAAVWTALSGDGTLAAGGALTVIGLQGRSLLPTNPSAGDVIKWNGASWNASPDDTGTGTIPAGTVTDSTLRWNGAAWQENANLLAADDGTLSLAHATSNLILFGSAGAAAPSDVSAGWKIKLFDSAPGAADYGFGYASAQLWTSSDGILTWHTGAAYAERMRVTATGELVLGAASAPDGARFYSVGNAIAFGDNAAAANKDLIAQIGAAAEPRLRYNVATSRWEFSNDGSTFTEIGGLGQAAPSGSAYVTIGADPTLTGERALTGTANQIALADGGANGNVVLSLPQNIHTGASPAFAGLTLTAMTTGSVLFAGAGGAVAQDNGGLFWSAASRRLGVGTAAPGAPIDVVGGDIRTDARLVSTVATGTSPLSVASTTLVANLNADLLDGNDASAFAAAAHTHTLTLAGSAGVPQTLTASGDTLTIAAGTNIATTAGATDTVTVATVANPTFATSVTTPQVSGPGVLALAATGANAMTLSTNGLERARIDDAGRFGVGTAAPGALLSVGANAFQVSAAGDLVKVNNVAYAWPSAQGAASTALVNDGAGNLSWAVIGGGGGGANTSLSNLTPTSVNQDLVPDSDNARDLGSAANRWRTLYLGTGAFIPAVYGGAAAGLDLTLESTTNAAKGDVLINPNGGNVAIGNAAPGTLFSVGANTFQVSAAGDLVKINNIAYAWPSAQGAASTALVNDGAGNLSWAVIGGGGGGANTSLSNLTPTSVNQDLVPDSDNARDLGSVTSRWRRLYIGTSVHTPQLESAAALALAAAGANALTFATNGAERIRIDANGNVGIGTSAPQNASLHVFGNALSIGDDSAAGNKIFFAQTGAVFEAALQYNVASNKWQIRPAGQSTFDDIATGAGGGGGANTSLSNLTATSINEALAPNADNVLDLGGAAFSWRSGYFDTSVVSPLHTFNGTLTLAATGANAVVVSTNGVERVRIDENGNVGIGTTAPQNASLHVFGNTLSLGDDSVAGGAPNKVLFAQTGNTPEPALQYNVASDTWQIRTLGQGFTDIATGGVAASWSLAGNAGVNPASQFLGTTDAQDLVVKTNNAERLRVRSAGDVAVSGGALLLENTASNVIGFGPDGIAPPSDASAGWKLRLFDSSPGVADFGFGLNVGDLWASSQGFFTWHTGDAYTERMRLTVDGELVVGAAATQDGALLYVADDQIAFGNDSGLTDKDIIAEVGLVNEPRLRYSVAGSKWQFSNDGTVFTDLGVSAGGTGAPVTSSYVTFGSELLLVNNRILAAAAPITLSNSGLDDGNITIGLGVAGVANGGTGSSSWTTGSVPFYDGAKLGQDNANLFWDDANNRLGIRTAAPSDALHVNGTVRVGNVFLQPNGNDLWTLGNTNGQLIYNFQRGYVDVVYYQWGDPILQLQRRPNGTSENTYLNFTNDQVPTTFRNVVSGQGGFNTTQPAQGIYGGDNGTSSFVVGCRDDFHYLKWDTTQNLMEFVEFGDFLFVNFNNGARNNLLRLGTGAANQDAVLKGALTQGGAPDLAENIDIGDPTLEGGDVAAADPSRRERIVKSSRPYQTDAVGVITTDPGLLMHSRSKDLDRRWEDHERPLVLAGRVPVKVTLEGGPIRIGDLLTTSSTPGHAMKAAEPWRGGIIGTALDQFGVEGFGVQGSELQTPNHDPQTGLPLASDAAPSRSMGKVLALVHLNPAPAVDPRVAEELSALRREIEAIKAGRDLRETAALAPASRN